MPDRDITDTPAVIRAQRSRRLRKRAPIFPATMLDQSLLELLTESDVPLGAYDLVDALRERGRRIVAMSVYRSLDRLCARKQIEKVEMISAFRTKDVAKPILMICTQCGRAQPLSAPSYYDGIARSVANTGFIAERIILEVAGLCSRCSASPLP